MIGPSMILVIGSSGDLTAHHSMAIIRSLKFAIQKFAIQNDQPIFEAQLWLFPIAR